MLEFIHADKYGEAFKVAKKFASKHEHRPILRYVNHGRDGSMIATDSHTALYIKDIHGFKEDYLVNPVTFDFARGNYPDVKKLLKHDGVERTVTLNKEQIRIWLQMHRSLNQLIKQNYKGRQHATIQFNDGVVSLKIDEENEIKINLPCDELNVNKEIKDINYNVAYMRDCLEAHVVMESESLEIITNGPMRMVILDNKEDVISVTLPVRTY